MPAESSECMSNKRGAAEERPPRTEEQGFASALSFYCPPPSPFSRRFNRDGEGVSAF